MSQTLHQLLKRGEFREPLVDLTLLNEVVNEFYRDIVDFVLILEYRAAGSIALYSYGVRLAYLGVRLNDIVLFGSVPLGGDERHLLRDFYRGGFKWYSIEYDDPSARDDG
jgi:hypothetical protein